ncbi:MAG: hypothetical protein WBA74_00390 [Cyclobacteriaceae bacterium]
MTIGERVKALMEYKEMNYRSFGSVVGYSDSQIRNIIIDKSIPRFDFIQTLLRIFPDLNSEWLIKGEGVMINANSLGEIELHSPQRSIPKIGINVYELLEDLAEEDDYEKRILIKKEVIKYIQQIENENIITLRELNSLRKAMMKHFNIDSK